ncbi:TadA family conjugal transfer-associated ATPase [Cryobacterium frigoriphilum]|uniref:TadA family conjugal transfer-associated ATPase n=1 Tax=Cryobacterium frigoriphilum TaxID=1259150 RepID=A0A4R8ZUC8_9MICO|nr:TadA family conjugal transfer-associated ATPase [Cryobacterium frigoriphilum]TFD45837.1 TadA family conjugal transfer-associated ATPase [Cryobacterium frigoriphilum]
MPEPFIAVPSYAVAPSVVAPSFQAPTDAAGPSPLEPVVAGGLGGTQADVLSDRADVLSGEADVLSDRADVLSGEVGVLDVSALGPLSPFAAGAGVTDLFVNGEAGLWVDRGRGAVHQPGWSSTEQALRALAVSLIARGGRHIDEATPCVDVRLADGIRVHAVLPPASSTGTLLSIRLPAARRPSFTALVAAGLCAEQAGQQKPGQTSVVEQRLRRAVTNRENMLITGAAGSGKTTLLAALLAQASPAERIVVIEDVAELRIAHPHVVALECRQANLEGAGRLGLDTLLREALRMRPDRLVLGECRGGEIRELLGALNTGHDGGAGTLHANSVTDVAARLEALGALAGLGPEAVARQAVSAIQLVVHLERRGGMRRVQALGRFALDARDRLVVITVTRAVEGVAAPRHAAGGGL